jgi:endonuclease YncB( thermonuclease family)
MTHVSDRSSIFAKGAHRFPVFASTGSALPDDIIGRPASSTATRWKFMEHVFAFWGIDAPESSQLCRGEDSLQYRCGAKAANDLDAFIARRPVSCALVSLDQYGRMVATCSVDRTDLAEWLVRNGLALDWSQYSKGKFDSVQREAEHAGRGMWAGSYVEPWLYRVCIRAGGSPSNCSDDANTHP